MNVRESVVEALYKGGSRTAYALAAELNYSPTSIYRALTVLQQRGLVQRSGPKRGGVWQLVSTSVRKN